MILMGDLSIVVHDEMGRDTIGPERARIDGRWGQERYDKLVKDWLGLWPHAALQIEVHRV